MVAAIAAVGTARADGSADGNDPVRASRFGLTLQDARRRTQVRNQCRNDSTPTRPLDKHAYQHTNSSSPALPPDEPLRAMAVTTFASTSVRTESSARAAYPDLQ
jgi:hypothetical protein